MKEDILEQLVDDYLQAKGYFTRHNLKFLPRKNHPEFESDQDSNHSDVDVLGFHPNLLGHDRVVVVSCKSWQKGFPVSTKLAELDQEKTVSGREAWRAFRELMVPKWSEAFLAAIQAATGCTQFTYITAVTAIKGDKKLWESNQRFQTALQGNPIRLLSLEDMLTELLATLNTTPSNSQLGRTLQLLKAAGCSFTMRSATKTTTNSPV